MLYDNLQDLVKHTHSLGFIDSIKIVGEPGKTTVHTITADRAVVMNGVLKNSIPELDDHTIGCSRMTVLNGLLNFPTFKGKGATVSVSTMMRDGGAIPAEIQFKSTQNHNASYRLMSKEAINDSLNVPTFKGVTWDVTVTPTKANITDLIYFAGVLGGYEPTFDVVTKNNELVFHIGTGPTDRSAIPIASEITGSMAHVWSWPLQEVLAILKLSDSSICKMNFSDKGVMMIGIDSGLGKYEYIIPAKVK